MELISESEFVDKLNVELSKNPAGAHLPPFILCDKGYDWPSDTKANEMIYRRVANIILEKYGISH